MAKGKLQETLKSNPTVYKISLTLYNFVRKLGDYAIRGYLRGIEFLLPSSFMIQSTPDLLGKHFPSYATETRGYSSRNKKAIRDGVRLISAKLLLDTVVDLKEGDYAELGTFRGVFASLIFKYKNPNSTLFCFDTFEGFAEEDVVKEYENTKLKTKARHFSDTSLELVKRNIAGSRESEGLELVKGYFPDTFKGMEDKKWRFVHLDADLYEPMKEGVNLFWPNIVKGGVLLIHDYNGEYVGTKKAIDEYFHPLGIKPIPLPDKVGSAVVIKQ